MEQLEQYRQSDSTNCSLVSSNLQESGNLGFHDYWSSYLHFFV